MFQILWAFSNTWPRLLFRGHLPAGHFPPHALGPCADLPIHCFPAGEHACDITRGNISLPVCFVGQDFIKQTSLFLTVNHITLSFTHFGLESSTTCTEDFLEILDGNYDDAPLRGTVAGALSSPSVASSGFYLYSCMCVCCHSRLECFQ